MIARNAAVAVFADTSVGVVPVVVAPLQNWDVLSLAIMCNLVRRSQLEYDFQVH